MQFILIIANVTSMSKDALKTTIFQGLFHDPDRKRAVDKKH
jgi:hypothetical protein